MIPLLLIRLTTTVVTFKPEWATNCNVVILGPQPTPITK